MAMPHLDAILATQGDHTFGVAAQIEFGELDVSFDDTADHAPQMLRSAWNSLGERTPETEGSAFFIGNSTKAGEFVAYRYLAEHNFEPEQVTGAHIMPTPLTYRPQSFEVERLGWLDENPQWREEWTEQPELPAPASRAQWIDLADAARTHRALFPDPRFRVIVAGKLMWTRIAPGRIRTEVIHEFNDTGDELDRLVANTLHPRAQIAPCGCGSDKRALDCHITAAADEPCPCERYNKTFRNCCMLTDAEAEQAPTLGLVQPRINA